MKTFFALVGAGTITFVGLGWYLDWYRLSRQPAPAGTQRLQVDLNPDKITGDVRKGIERGGEIIDRLREDQAKPENGSGAQTPADAGPATKFFSPPPSVASNPTNPENVWKSLDTAPPPADSFGQPTRLDPPRR